MCVLVQHLINDIFGPSNETFRVPTDFPLSKWRNYSLPLSDRVAPDFNGWVRLPCLIQIYCRGVPHIDIHAHNAWHVSYFGKRTSSLLHFVLLLYSLGTAFAIIIYGSDTGMGGLVRESSGRRRVRDLIVSCALQIYYLFWLEMMNGDMMHD